MQWLRVIVISLALAVLVGPTIVLYAQAPKDKADGDKAERKMSPEELDKAQKENAKVVGTTCCGVTGVGLVVVAILGLIVYVTPTAIALVRGHPNLAPIVVVNLLLGWSVIGWIVALAWSVSTYESKRHVRRATLSRDQDEYD